MPSALQKVLEFEQKISEVKKELEAHRKRVVFLRNKIKELHNQSAIACKEFQAISKEDLTEIYWNTETNTKLLAEGLGISISTLRKERINPFQYDTCQCGNPICFYSKAQKMMNERQKLCKECQKKWDELWKKRNLEEWEKREKKREEEATQLETLPYKEYLQTEHWQHTRKQALKRARYQCELCSSQGKLHVHHKHYRNKGNEYPADLIVLCEPCHQKFHDKMPGGAEK